MRGHSEAKTVPFAALAGARNAIQVLRLLRAPVVCTVVSVLALAVPEQTHEIIRVLAQKTILPYRGWERWLELGLAVAGLPLLAFILWWVSSRLAQRQPFDMAPGARRALDPVARGLVLAVFAGAALAIWWARTPAPTAETREGILASLLREQRIHRDAWQSAIDTLFSYNTWLAYAALATAIAGIAMSVLLPRIGQSPLRDGEQGIATLLGRRASAVAYGLVAALILLFIVSPVAVADSIGAMAVLFAFLICLALILAQFSYWSDRHGVPYLLVLIAWIGAVSLLDLNDNHEIYRAAPAEPERKAAAASAPKAPADLDAAFTRWWESRPDKAAFERRGQPYPVYVVAAQGGGIYAAYHTTSILGGLQDDCPAFAHHLFAISSVSGGSIGAATFAGLVKQTETQALAEGATSPCRETPRPYRESMVDLADAVLSQDLLSPLLAAMLFPDFLQQPLPVPVPPFDRALRFEKAFERAMGLGVAKLATSRTRRDKPVGPNFLAGRYADHWTADGSTPALVVNTTEVGSGRRRVIAPFEFARDELLFVPVAQTFPAGHRASRIRDLPVSTAAALSARFPWVTPAGTFFDYARDPLTDKERRDAPLQKYRVVDGAYFENSGVATALDLVRAMEAAARSAPQPFADKIRIRLIVLTRGGYPSQTFYGLGEAISPIQALLNTQTSRAFITIAEAERQLNVVAPTRTQAQAQLAARRLHKINLLDLGYPPPLGWQLSPITMFLIKAQNGITGACKPAAGSADRRQGRFRSDADGDCLLQDIAHELKGG